jgi:hypothetical protein
MIGGAAVATVTGLLSPRGWKILGIAAVIAAIVFCFWWALDAYGDREFAAGQAKERSAWEQAEKNFQRQAEQARTEADAKAVQREIEHAAEVRKEREEIDEAVAEGRSPFDVLFPGSVQ